MSLRYFNVSMQPLTSPEYVRQVILSTLTVHETDTFPEVTQAARQAFAGFLQAALSLVLLMVISNVANSHFAGILGWAAWIGVSGLVLDKKYSHLRYFNVFLATCAETLLRIQLEAIAASPLISILLDNSTDKSTEEHCLIYIRYLDMNSLQAKTEYLCTVKLFSKTGLSMFKTIQLVFKVLDIPLSKLAGLCTDGDSAMIGNRNGVRGLLRQVCPYLLSAHCAAHKSALVMSDVEKNHPLVQQVDSVLKDTHNFFSRSPKKAAAWKRYAKAHGITAFKFPMFNTTRWFSRMVCIKTLLKNLPQLIVFLSKPSIQRELDGAAVLLQKVSQVDTIMAMHGICDALEPLEHFRLFFQSDDVLPHAVKARMETTCAALDVLTQEGALGGSNMKRFWSSLKRETLRWTRKPTANQQPVTVQLLGAYNVQVVEEFLTSFTSDIKSHLQDRFPESDLLECFHIFDPKSYLDLQMGKQLDSFGISELKRLLQHVGHADLLTKLIDLSDPVIRHQIFREEFPSMKQALWQRSRRRTSLGMSAVWAEFKEAGRETTMPHMFRLVMLGLVVPLNTACVERGFSHHGIIKNKLRTRLKIVHVDSLLRVKLLCHDYKGFAYTRAMDLHYSMKSGLISKLASDVDRLQFADFEEDMAGEDFVDFSPPSESDASDDCGFIFSESDEECQEVQDIQQEIPSTLYPLSNAEDAGPEVGDDFASELGY